MIVGFTGTQHGMTYQQKAGVEDVLSRYPQARVAMHGGCVGGDVQFHNLARGLGLAVEIYPQDTNEKKRAKFEAGPGVFIHPPRPALKRNHVIVEACDILIAAPRQKHEMRRSGTWATIRYARELFVPLYRIDPEGFEFND